MPDLKLYTVAQLREWIEHNRAAEGLSETIIAPHRAYAIIYNPYVKDDDPVVAAIFVDGVNAAYTTAFPEKIGDKRYWWFSSLWCDPKHRGNGYGLIVIGSLVEVYGAEYCLDRWGAQETVEIFTYLSLKTTYTQRYHLGATIRRNSAKGKSLYGIRKMQIGLHRMLERYKHEDYTLRYLSYIDDATYAFIAAHSKNDYLHHTQDYLNWGLHYSFVQSTPLMERVATKMPFSQAESLDVETYAVQVLDGEIIIGFYIMKKKEDGLHVLYLYYDEAHMNQVFASIRDHVKQMRIALCVTENIKLADYLRKQIYFPKFSTSKVSFSYPESMPQPKSGQVQYGDGDCLLL